MEVIIELLLHARQFLLSLMHLLQLTSHQAHHFSPELEVNKNDHEVEQLIKLCWSGVRHFPSAQEGISVSFLQLRHCVLAPRHSLQSPSHG